MWHPRPRCRLVATATLGLSLLSLETWHWQCGAQVMQPNAAEDSMYRAFVTLSFLALPWAPALLATVDNTQARPAQMRFEAMDRNRDGAISRDEWQGSARSF